MTLSDLVVMSPTFLVVDSSAAGRQPGSEVVPRGVAFLASRGSVFTLRLQACL